MVDVRCREFRERTIGTAHRVSTKSTTGRTADTNCDHTRELGRANEFDP